MSAGGQRQVVSAWTVDGRSRSFPPERPWLIYVHMGVSGWPGGHDLLRPLVSRKGSGEMSMSLLFDDGLCKVVSGRAGWRKDVCFPCQRMAAFVSSPSPATGRH